MAGAATGTAWGEGASRCVPSIYALRSLAGEYGESVVDSQMITTKDGKELQVQLWENKEKETWTLTVTNGPVMCVLSAGTGGIEGRTLDDLLHPSSVRL